MKQRADITACMLMYSEKEARHNIPHLHARLQEDEVAVDFEGNIMEGGLPPKKMRMLLAWIDLHKEELESNWTILQEGGDYFRYRTAALGG